MAIVDKSGDRVRKMFAEIAPRYDQLNHLLSFNSDKRWRKRVIEILRLPPGLPVLDTCTGTGDLAIEMAKKLGPTTRIVGSDFCPEMLQLAERKRNSLVPEHHLEFLEADSQSLPFRENEFNTVTVAFGLRNVATTELGLSEMVRVCCSGGEVAILEFSKPTIFGLRHMYQAYFKHVLPRIGQGLSKNSQSAYRYLPESVHEFPSGEALAQMMRNAELIDIRMFPMTLGVVTLYVGTKP